MSAPNYVRWVKRKHIILEIVLRFRLAEFFFSLYTTVQYIIDFEEFEHNITYNFLVRFIAFTYRAHHLNWKVSPLKKKNYHLSYPKTKNYSKISERDFSSSLLSLSVSLSLFCSLHPVLGSLCTSCTAVKL